MLRTITELEALAADLAEVVTDAACARDDPPDAIHRLNELAEKIRTADPQELASHLARKLEEWVADEAEGADLCRHCAGRLSANRNGFQYCADCDVPEAA